ncbi:unnamed protein product, partial [Prorocentrum cordatum]
MDEVSNPSTVSSFDQGRLSMSVRFLAGPMRDLIWRFRYAAILVLPLLSALGGLTASLGLSLASGAPQVFAERTNLGRQQLLLMRSFSSYDVSDLDKAIAVFSPLSSKERYCPGLLP